MLSSQCQPVSMTINVRQQKMLQQLPDRTFCTSSTSPQQQPLHMDGTRISKTNGMFSSLILDMEPDLCLKWGRQLKMLIWEVWTFTTKWFNISWTSSGANSRSTSVGMQGQSEDSALLVSESKEHWALALKPTLSLNSTTELTSVRKYVQYVKC